MYRFIADIIDLEKIEERKDGNFKAYTLRLKLRIKNIFPSCPKPPPYIKGRTVWVTREYPHPFEPKTGDSVILSPDEIADVIPTPHGDINRDGYKEILLKNDLVSATILPHRGARIGSLSYKDREYFGTEISYASKKWIDIGGVFDSVDGKIPGFLACARFEEQNKVDKKTSSKPKADDKNLCLLKYSKKGFEITKKYTIDSCYPIISETTNVEVKRKKKIIYSKYLPIKTVKGDNALYVPTNEKLEHRYHQIDSVLTYWRPIDFCGLKLDSFLMGDEKAGFLYATHKTNLRYLKLQYSIRSFRLHLFSEKRELKKGGSFTYNCVYALGDKYRVTKNSIIIKSDSPDKTLFIVRADDKFKGSIKWKNREIQLKPVFINDAVKLWLN